jgi:hypothetical protein
MCDKFVEAFRTLREQSTEADKNFIKEAKFYSIKRKEYRAEYYLWKEYNEVKFYRNYDKVYDTIDSRTYVALKIGERKLENCIYIEGLPKECYENFGKVLKEE